MPVVKKARRQAGKCGCSNKTIRELCRRLHESRSCDGPYLAKSMLDNLDELEQHPERYAREPEPKPKANDAVASSILADQLTELYVLLRARKDGNDIARAAVAALRACDLRQQMECGQRQAG